MGDSAARVELEESDVVFARPDGLELLARVYRPRGDAGAPRPALVDAHGGAWTRNDRTAGALYARGLAAAGVVVVSVDFRQAPDHRHPAAAKDVAAGVRWTRAHARHLGVDPRRIGLAGASSGGQLALLIALLPGAPAHAGTPIVAPDGTLTTEGEDDVRCVLALYPVVDPLARYRYVLAREAEPPSATGFNAARLIAAHRAYFRDETDMLRASVTRIVAGHEAWTLPPVWLAQPEQDDNVPAEITDAFVTAYEKEGGVIERARFPGTRHSFAGQPGPDTDRAVALMREFVARRL